MLCRLVHPEKAKSLIPPSFEFSSNSTLVKLLQPENLYVFIDDTTIIVGENKYELTSMSYVEVTNNYIKLYNKKTNEFTFLENYEGDVEAYTEEYVINLCYDTVTYRNEYYLLLKNIDDLNVLDLS